MRSRKNERNPLPWRTLAALLGSVCLAGCPPSEDSATPAGDTDTESAVEGPTVPTAPQPLGELTLESPNGCAEFALPGGTCAVYRVTCDGTDSDGMQVGVRVTPPVGEPRGAILFGSGSLGTTPYFGAADGNDAVAYGIGEALREAGYTTIERAWVDDNGWFGGGATSMLAASCRYATLVDGLRDQLPTEQPLCAAGNSAGSFELAMGLSWYDVGNNLSFALMNAGPVSRMDLGCTGDWDCEAGLDDYPVTCADPQCGVGDLALAFDLVYGEGVCTSLGDDEADRTLLASHSPELSPALPVDTPTGFLWGSEDCLGISVSGRRYAQALEDAGGQVSRGTVAGAPHELQRDAAGAAAIVQALIDNCGGDQ